MWLFGIHDIHINVTVNSWNSSAAALLPDIKITLIVGFVNIVSEPYRRRILDIAAPEVIKEIFAAVKHGFITIISHLVGKSKIKLVQITDIHAVLLKIRKFFPIKSNRQISRFSAKRFSYPSGVFTNIIDRIIGRIKVNADIKSGSFCTLNIVIK